MKLTGSAGSVDVQVGDRFVDMWRDKSIEWEIASFTGGSIYSPSGFGGTPIIRCKPLCGADKLDQFWRNYLEDDGTVEWCGDSIASLIIAGRAALKEPRP